MLGLAHVHELGASRALGPPLDDLDARHVLVVDLVPHLNADLAEVVSEEDRRVNARTADGQAHARKGFAAATMRHHEHVADAGGVARLGEEGGARTGRVHARDLLLGQQRHRVRGRLGHERWQLRVGDLEGFGLGDYARGRKGRRALGGCEDGESGASLFGVLIGDPDCWSTSIGWLVIVGRRSDDMYGG